MAKRRKSKYPPPLKPHVEEGEYGATVSVMRIPAGTKPADRQEAMRQIRNQSKLYSRETYW